MWNGNTSDALRATQFLISSSPHRPIPGPLIQRRIVGYHQDQLGDWVAELECGHGQHVRHDPPWQVREWVTTEAGRHRSSRHGPGVRASNGCDRRLTTSRDSAI